MEALASARARLAQAGERNCAVAAALGVAALAVSALVTMSREQLHGALLDVRLDGETIDEVAEALVARGVPVLLATGYEKAQLPPSLQHLPRVRKPYDEEELRRLLERAYR